VRFGEDSREDSDFAFEATPGAQADAIDCERRLDPHWFGACLERESDLIASR
jgi:hypothetical protein